MILVKNYEAHQIENWNSFVGTSKNGNFLFDRRYMEYHSDRFEDCSLMFFNGRERLIGVMPASRHDGTVISHGGLTYGGVISNEEMKTATMLHLFDAMINHLVKTGNSKLIYKSIPHIFHRVPSEEDLYALFVNNAILYRRDASSAIYLPERIKFAKGKKEGIKKAQRANLEVKASQDFTTFFDIGLQVMRDRHNLAPVHTCEEMTLLAGRFPENIHLHASFAGERMLAGALTYLFSNTVHVQYMYNSDEGLEHGALDIVLDRLINHTYKDLSYFSFGVSSEDGGKRLNEGLIHQKEMFGARSVVHDFYEISLT